MDYKKNKRYFSKKSIAKIACICFVAGLILCSLNVMLGLLVIAAGVAVIFLFRRPTDAEIDEAVIEATQELKAVALKKLGLDECVGK